MLASACVLEKLHGATFVVSACFWLDVVRRRVCHSLPKTVLVRWCHSAAFDIASLVLDDGSCR